MEQEQEKQKQLDPRELEVRFRSITDQRNNAMDTISILNGQLYMAQEEIRRLQKLLEQKEEPKRKKVSEVTATH